MPTASFINCHWAFNAFVSAVPLNCVTVDGSFSSAFSIFMPADATVLNCIRA
jgi:hypothetical protein